jgi:hypothetical protein
MIALAAFVLAAEPEPLSLEPFMDEEVAAHAFEVQVTCLGTEAFNRRNDTRDSKAVAADVVSACSANEATLRSALADVYRRKPSLVQGGQTADEAAADYVSQMDSRMVSVIEEGREHK